MRTVGVLFEVVSQSTLGYYYNPHYGQKKVRGSADLHEPGKWDLPS